MTLTRAENSSNLILKEKCRLCNQTCQHLRSHNAAKLQLLDKDGPIRRDVADDRGESGLVLADDGLQVRPPPASFGFGKVWRGFQARKRWTLQLLVSFTAAASINHFP